jgi:hypothetical protein
MTRRPMVVSGGEAAKGGRSPVPGSGSRPSDRAADGVSPVPASIPNATVNHDLCIGIVSPYGQMWTWEAFENCDDAEKRLRDFWGKQADEMAPQFKLCQVRVEVIPESEPFGLPSALATEARRAETLQDGSVHDGAGPKDNAQDESAQ